MLIQTFVPCSKKNPQSYSPPLRGCETPLQRWTRIRSPWTCWVLGPWVRPPVSCMRVLVLLPRLDCQILVVWKGSWTTITTITTPLNTMGAEEVGPVITGIIMAVSDRIPLHLIRVHSIMVFTHIIIPISHYLLIGLSRRQGSLRLVCIQAIFTIRQAIILKTHTTHRQPRAIHLIIPIFPPQLSRSKMVSHNNAWAVVIAVANFIISFLHHVVWWRNDVKARENLPQIWRLLISLFLSHFNLPLLHKTISDLNQFWNHPSWNPNRIFSDKNWWFVGSIFSLFILSSVHLLLWRSMLPMGATIGNSFSMEVLRLFTPTIHTLEYFSSLSALHLPFSSHLALWPHSWPSFILGAATFTNPGINFLQFRNFPLPSAFLNYFWDSFYPEPETSVYETRTERWRY